MTRYDDTGSFGRILYTGDFRWCEAMVIDPVLQNLSESKVFIFIIISSLVLSSILFIILLTEFKHIIHWQHIWAYWQWISDEKAVYERSVKDHEVSIQFS